MDITLFMAMSLNGMIATEAGDEDFLSDDNWQCFTDLVKEYGNFIIGRKTYEVVSKWDNDFGFLDFVNAKKVIVSSNPDFVAEGFNVVISPVEAIGLLEQNGFKKGLVSGGSINNSSFIKLGLITDVIINVEPAIIGRGVPIFKEDDFLTRLSLVSSKAISNGIVQLSYKVRK